MHLFENTTTRMKRPGAKYKHCEVVRKNFNNMFPLPPPTSPISISWQFASYVIFIHELGKHPHNVLEDGKKEEEELLKEKSESIPRGLILSFRSILIPADSLSRAGENGKYRASYYLFTYLHFLPFSTPLNGISSRRHPNCPLGASWVAEIS